MSAREPHAATGFSLAGRLREAAERWMPGVDFGPDLLREAADALDAGGLWTGADPRIVTLRRERDEARRGNA